MYAHHNNLVSLIDLSGMLALERIHVDHNKIAGQLGNVFGNPGLRCGLSCPALFAPPYLLSSPPPPSRLPACAPIGWRSRLLVLGLAF